MTTAIRFYEHTNYRGRMQWFRLPASTNTYKIPFVGGHINDIWSSVLVTPGFGVTAYEHANYNGRARTWLTSDSNIHNDGFADNISSLKIFALYNSNVVSIWI